MKIEILGMGCFKCRKLYENAQVAVKELGLEAEIVKVEDIAKITDYGVMATPALVIDGVVKAAGRIPTPDEIKKALSAGK
ncbi:MAG: TM0996/MTH895 family glutaredoxin-like protein [Candidatus Omnitrophica bacterium]|nr:TM0996/MTH895 family glutaredoxin-like protein [Candidatus Omnitrophota bacterium]MBU4140586.1 TM0996/MTH895 family glutaredoxin-like protein [Candidatus Omnitrophota bacterium]